MVKRLVQWVLILLLGVLMAPFPASGQMFSVEEDRRRQRQGPANRIYVGFEPSDFTYYGPEQTEVQRTSYDMNSPILRLRYETMGTDLFLGYGDDFTGSDNIAFFHIGGSFSRLLPLHRSETFRMSLPLRLQADLTTASHERAYSEKFQQSNILIGAGPELEVSITPDVRWSAQVVPHIGYSLSPGGTFGGAAYQFSGETRLYADELFNSVGLSVGYDYTFKRFDVSVERFNYLLRSHSLLIGVSF